MDHQPHPTSATRRQLLQLGAKASSFLALSSLFTTLAACNNKRTGQVGQPIPADPIVSSRHPNQTWSPPSSSSPTTSRSRVAPSQLTELPDFVIPRTKWTKGKTNPRLADRMTTINRITVHHDAISPVPSGNYADSVRRLSSIRRGHLGNQWADIGYHYAIDPAGRAWQARPLTYQGAHVKATNFGNIGIVVFGNYEHSHPTNKALTTLNTLIAHEMKRFDIPLNRVYTHRELKSTACPGRHLQAQMNKLRQPNGRLATTLKTLDYA